MNSCKKKTLLQGSGCRLNSGVQVLRRARIKESSGKQEPQSKR
jgi:hypothetical protein